ncbi:MAG: protein translocase subunit SecD, partial [Bacteroidota bacterium]
MRNKSTIIALLTVFTLICGYNLFWTYQQYSLESRVTPYRVASDSIRVAKPDSAAWTTEDLRITHDFDSIQSTLATERQEAAARSFTLGLDLQGGMYVTMEVKISDLINQLASEPEDPQFMAAIACADQKRAEEALPYIDLFIDCFQENVPDGNLGATFTNDEYEIGFGTSDDEVIQFLRDQAVSGMDRTFQIIRARIDGFGVVSPNLQKLDNNRILLELPGVKDEERVKKLLKQTAELEFYVGYSYRESYPILRLINEKLKEIQGIVEVDTAATENIASAEDAETPAVDDSTANDSSSVDTLAADTAKAFEDMTPEEQEEARAQFRAENPLFAVLGQFDFSQPRFTESNTPLVGFAAEADIPTINKYFEMDEVQEIIPEDMKFVWGFKPTENGIVELISVKKSEDGGAALGGDAVSDARQDFDGNTGEPVVSMTMNIEGGQQWADITQIESSKNPKGHVAVLLDGRHYTYPRVINPIQDGRTQITGGYTNTTEGIGEAKDLANVLQAGQLPVSTVLEGSQTVGPSLGAENINNAMLSFLIAFLFILAFMAFYYAKAGLVSNVALIANLVFILGLSAAFTIVFTLPGLAAVVLTVGMAVDANVLIFERIREELAKDKTLKASIKAGFANAFSSVMDANITTFLTGVVLAVSGVGPIRGFAVSLIYVSYAYTGWNSA